MNETILIVDDEPDILTLLSSVLEHEGYKVLTASNGMEGMEWVRKGQPDLVITDVKMPKDDGLGLLRNIKEAGIDVDVIILTGHSDETTAIECLRSGAYDYLLKPLEELDVILVSIERAFYKRMLEIKNKQLLRQLEEAAVRDPLTQLLNFRQLDQYLDDEIARSSRYNHHFCGLMLDIDRFQNINNTYGQIFGDYILEKLGEIIRRNLRTTDRFFRYGGDEFFIIMPETGEEEANIGANRLMTAVKAYEFVCDAHQTKITLSVGGVLYPEQANTKTEVIRHTSKALFQAKEMGGDMILFGGGPS